MEGVQSWLEAVTYQMQNMSHEQQAKHLAGLIGSSNPSTRTRGRMDEERRSSAGSYLLRRGWTDRGAVSEVNKFAAILGGSEEIMADLGVRQAMCAMPNARL